MIFSGISTHTLPDSLNTTDSQESTAHIFLAFGARKGQLGLGGRTGGRSSALPRLRERKERELTGYSKIVLNMI
jgi:hypothetical protein